MSIISERDEALKILAKNLSYLEMTGRKGYKEYGRGGVIIHTKSIVDNGYPKVLSYTNKKAS